MPSTPDSLDPGLLLCFFLLLLFVYEEDEIEALDCTYIHNCRGHQLCITMLNTSTTTMYYVLILLRYIKRQISLSKYQTRGTSLGTTCVSKAQSKIEEERNEERQQQRRSTVINI